MGIIMRFSGARERTARRGRLACVFAVFLPIPLIQFLLKLPTVLFVLGISKICVPAFVIEFFLYLGRKKFHQVDICYVFKNEERDISNNSIYFCRLTWI